MSPRFIGEDKKFVGKRLSLTDRHGEKFSSVATTDMVAQLWFVEQEGERERGEELAIPVI